MTEFLVHDSWRKDKKLFVSGIVNSGTIHVGTGFIALRHTSSQSPDIEQSLSDTLIVSRIEAYGTQIESLPTGMSGALEFEQREGRQPVHGDILTGK